MSNEKWSPWIEWHGGSIPVSPSDFVEIRQRDGDVEDGEARAFYWLHDREPSDITAYRYRIQENEMHPDLKWLAENVSEWPNTAQSGIIVRHSRSGLSGGWIVAIAKGWGNDNPDFFWFNEWLQARKDLGLIMTDAEEELPAEDWAGKITDTPEEAAMVEDMVNGKSDMVNAPPHYQLRPGYEVYDLRQDLAAKAANGGATYDQYSDWDRATEYLVRMWGKNKLEDLKKCRWYVDKLIEKLEAE